MEKINWFYNSDFEKNLAIGNFNIFHSTPMTQEFEYFINFLDPTASIYTTKKYNEEFLNRFKDFTNHPFLYNHKKENLKNWCQEYKNIDLLKKFQSKEILIYFKNKGLIKHELQVIQSEDDIDLGYLYKEPFSVSGMGIHDAGKDINKIKKLLKTTSLIKEKKLDRLKDFSTLVENNKILCHYENSINEHYHYTGTLLNRDFELADSQKEKINQVVMELKDYTGICSIDSFIYADINEAKEVLQPVSEINMRKTMGYISFKFKEKYFSNKKVAKLILIKNTSKSEKITRLKNCLLLSPLDNKFLVYFLWSDSREEILRLENEINNELFPAIF